ncbi:MAG: hypothetical protein ABJA71_13680 [Ginsengibacter sp.]
MNFLHELRNRNALLYWFGWYNILAGIICLLLIVFDDMHLLGISRWIKPAKFFLSVGIMVFTMGWILYYLQAKKSVTKISWLIVISMLFENGIIALQAIRGERSHFNVTNGLNSMLFSLMGLFILVFTLTVVYAVYLFFRQKVFTIPPSYYWGIRMGLLFFIFFSLEGGLMLSLMSHTVGGSDGEPGLPLVNWSIKYGDLRISHFLGIHSLQLLPLAGYYIAGSKKQIILLSVIYFFVVMALLVQALSGIPLFF